ncbi:MAG: hypothetical protein K6T63_15285 [Alicyclobacillus herbarius]|nr:hypothetical protein [Alicyclobacillus herbarius]MCL6633980.1 hypothetical protein [Alicyclobacillus herbarius]
MTRKNLTLHWLNGVADGVVTAQDMVYTAAGGGATLGMVSGTAAGCGGG